MIVTADPLDRTADRPLYKQLADRLREQISSGELAPGQDLPTEASLASRYDCGRDTVRDALHLLRAEGLIITERGRPAYVVDPSAPQVVTLAPGDQVEVRGGTVTVTRREGKVERYQTGTVRISSG